MPDLAKLSASIMAWLRSVMDVNHPGRFDICLDGAVVRSSETRGLGPSSLAAKIAYTVGGMSCFDSWEIESWAGYINSFQQDGGKNEGMFLDKYMRNAHLPRLALIPWSRKARAKRARANSVARAETRQACAGLGCLGFSARYAVRSLPESEEEIVDWIQALDWSKPWHACSHTGHLLFLLKYNADYFGRMQIFEELEPAIWRELDSHRDPETGCWGSGNAPILERVNGAMKALTMYQLVGRTVENAEQLLDFALDAEQKRDGCHVLDLLYVVHGCARETMHRRNEVKDFARSQIKAIMACKQDDGAFSFFPGRAQTRYLGQDVSRGLPESDIHGTHLYTWALCLVDDILRDFSDPVWKHPIT